jgi:hypothetical protein
MSVLVEHDLTYDAFIRKTITVGILVKQVETQH